MTEQLWPGYRISRAAYVVSLLRPRIVRELELERFGLRLLPRTPSSLTPLPDGRSLLLGPDPDANVKEIARFSEHDARVFPRYQELLERIARALEPALDLPPPDLQRPHRLLPWLAALRAGLVLRRHLPRAARLLLGSARDLLEEWFDSEPLRSTLATDAVIGAFASPSSPGTGYVLFHHVMGRIGGGRGVWAYVEGGMGRLAGALAGAARAAGAELRTGVEVGRIRNSARGAWAVTLASGEEIPAEVVVSGIDPARTIHALEEPEHLPEEFLRAIRTLDFRSPVVKINLALQRLPRFRLCDREAPPLSGTIHLGPLDLDDIERAFQEAREGEVSRRPLVELTIPSVLDPTLAPRGRWVASIFAQYAPARDMDHPDWPRLRDQMRDRALEVVEEAAPGFRDSIENLEVLAPPDLERIFGLSGGNIFHGAMTPDRLLFLRPVVGWSRYRTPIRGLWLCGSGTHPGGGVMGAPGRNAAREILRDLPGCAWRRRRARGAGLKPRRTSSDKQTRGAS